MCCVCVCVVCVKVWNLESLEVAHVLKSKGASVYCLAITDKDIICGTYENTIQVILCMYRPCMYIGHVSLDIHM